MAADVQELALVGEPEDVPRARRFTVKTLLGGPFEAHTDDAAMAVTELVTNALLHAGPPVRLKVVRTSPLLRIEVHDRSRTLPIRALSGEESMTGRGLALVETLASRWGAELTPTGKVVWCELGSDVLHHPPQREEGDVVHHGGLEERPPATDAVGAPGTPEPVEEAPTRHTVYLGDAPTELLLAAKAHVDNLVRELTLMSVGAAAGQAPPLPPRLVTTIETMVHAFAEARTAIKQRAIAAAREGRERTDLVLTVPDETMNTAQAYLAALDEADAYARAGHLLTLETPTQQRIFRRWYVESLAEQLRAVTKGELPPPAKTFEQRLLEEVVVVAAAQRAAERTARLQQVTAALAAVSTIEDVARVVVQEGMTSLGAAGGGLVVPARDGKGLDVLGAAGYTPHFVDPAALSDLADLPVSLALRDGVPIWVRTPAERDERFPLLASVEPPTASVCAVPLRVSGQVFGVLRFGFEEPQAFDDDERTFLLALAAQTAQALERTVLHRAEREARSSAEALARRLERLQQVTAEMAGAAHVDEMTDIIVTNLADALGSVITSLSMLDGEVLRLVRMRGAQPGVSEQWETFGLDLDVPASEAARTGKIVVVPDATLLPDRYPLLAGQGRREGSLVCLPLAVRKRLLGVVTMSFPPGVVVDDPAELRFLATLANTCAQALDRAKALTQAGEASERLALLAEASAELADSRGYRETLTRIARLVVPGLADWCSITLVENGVLQPVTIAHVDPEKVEWATLLQERYPADLDSPTGTGNVIRTGRSELYTDITDDVLAATAVDDEQLRILRELQLSSVLFAPLTGRTGTFGSLQLAYAESGRHYGEGDRALVEDLARRAAVAVENARAFESQQARLVSISRVAEVAQHAILAPVPSRCGPVQLAGAYVSASKDALIGGDHYEVVMRQDVVRMLIGDVRGKGLEAVRLATVVLGLFRTAAADHADVVEVARQMDARVGPYLGEEDFVTALLVDVATDGLCTLVCCGHPSPLLARDGVMTAVECTPTVPLGLGVEPQTRSLALRPGDRLLLFTDGLIETRDSATGEFVELEDVAEPLAEGEIGGVLGNILAKVQEAAGQRLSDDLAMLVMEYAPE